MSFLNDIIKASGNQYAASAADGIEGSDIRGFIDTGSYAFNALVSGSIHGGMPDNKIIALAGESATGKTYFALGMCKKFLDDRPDGVVLYFDTEQSVTSDMISGRGIDSKRLAIFPVATVEEFRHQALQIVDKYIESKEKKPVLMVLDSLGMLSTEKEVTDTADGKNVRDMTRAQAVKSTFRVLTLKLGKAGIPLVMTNHTYDVVGSYFPTKEMGGGCLVSGTKVETQNGPCSIEYVEIGDRVLTLFGYREVTNTFKFDDKQLYRIEFEDGSTVECSEDHRFMVESDNGYEWVCAKDLSRGIDLVELDSSIHTTRGN